MMENVSKGSRSNTVASTIPEDDISTREPSIAEEPLFRTDTVAGSVFASAETRSTDLDRNGKITGEGGCDELLYVSGHTGAPEMEQSLYPSHLLRNAESEQGHMGVLEVAQYENPISNPLEMELDQAVTDGNHVGPNGEINGGMGCMIYFTFQGTMADWRKGSFQILVLHYGMLDWIKGTRVHRNRVNWGVQVWPYPE